MWVYCIKNYLRIKRPLRRKIMKSEVTRLERTHEIVIFSRNLLSQTKHQNCCELMSSLSILFQWV